MQSVKSIRFAFPVLSHSVAPVRIRTFWSNFVAFCRFLYGCRPPSLACLVPHTTIVHFLNKQSIMRQITIFFFCLGFLLPINALMAQEFLNNSDMTLTTETATGYRPGRLGIGFTAPYLGPTGFDAALGATPRARFAVRDGILAHYGGQGVIGAFSGKWCGLGEGNPDNLFGLPNPYGLSIASNNNVGFLNLFPQNNRNDLVLGFGISGGANTNRFVLRGYSGTSASVGKDLMITNPDGATGINAEPQSTFWVDATLDEGPTAKNIAIIDQQIYSSLNGPIVPQRTRASSGMGAQANVSLANSGIVVEGFRAQIGQFGNPALIPPGINNNPEVAVNLQAVKSPFGGPNAAAIDAVSVLNVNGTNEYAELTWQDLSMDPNQVLSSTSCDAANGGLSIQTAEALSKFFISFRNSQNVNPFGARNKLPVMTFQGNGRVGIGTLQPTSGTGCDPLTGTISRPILLDVNGGMVSNGALVSSDRRFKQDIKPVTNAMELLRKVQGTTYEFKKADFPDRNFPEGNQYGFIAQDLEKVMPEAAFENSDGYYVANYTMLIPVLTEAIKEKDKELTELRTEMAEMRQQINDIKANQQLGSTEGFRLEQNAPNPFGDNTVIGYATPAGTTGARISVYDLTGRTIKSIVLTEGAGSITITAGELGAGLYIYDLQVNGRQILERKMTVVGK
jgi:hypothetical protein